MSKEVAFYTYHFFNAFRSLFAFLNCLSINVCRIHFLDLILFCSFNRKNPRASAHVKNYSVRIFWNIFFYKK